MKLAALVLLVAVPLCSMAESVQTYDFTVAAVATGFPKNVSTQPFCHVFKKEMGKFYSFGIEFFLSATNIIFGDETEALEPRLVPHQSDAYSFDGSTYRIYRRLDLSDRIEEHTIIHDFDDNGATPTGHARYESVTTFKSGEVIKHSIVCQPPTS